MQTNQKYTQCKLTKNILNANKPKIYSMVEAFTLRQNLIPLNIRTSKKMFKTNF